MKVIQGGVCAASGFTAGAVHSGIRKARDRDDLALIVSSSPCQAAAVYTHNQVKADPLQVTRDHLSDHTARAVIVNSGNANACAMNGHANAVRQCEAAARYLGVDVDDMLVASTGVIGQELPIACIEQAVDQIALSADNDVRCARAIMTTDTKEKMAAVSFEIGGVTCHLGGIAKGSGMIHPNMGTMLAFITTDCAVSAQLLQKLLYRNTQITFNRVSVDGDTSTNDMCIVLANGQAGNAMLEDEDEQSAVFEEALHAVMEDLAKKIAADGEGADRLMTCTVTNAADEQTAETLAMSICSSSLVKAAMFGADANWGRVLCAMGYSGAKFDPQAVSVTFASAAGEIVVCENGKGLLFDEDLAKTILSEDHVEIRADVHQGNAQATCWGCDLTYDYVKINGDYRT